METMHAAGRRTLPPVPRPSADRSDAATEATTAVAASGPLTTMTLERPVTPPATAFPETTEGDAFGEATNGVADPDLCDTGRFVLIEEPETPRSAATDPSPPGPAAEAGDDAPALSLGDPLDVDGDDPAQQFVARLRSAAIDFAEAAGAADAVVREAVPPARHRRARCRVVLRYPDGSDADLTFLGPVERAGRAARRAFDADITRWLGSGSRQDSEWMVADEDAPGGFAVDVNAWVTAD